MSKDSRPPPDLAFIPAPSTSKPTKTPSKKPQPKPNVPATSTAKAMKAKKEQQLKDRAGDAKQAAEKNPYDVNKLLEEVQRLEEVCSALTCKSKIKDFSIGCNHCQMKFCTQHYLPEVHGCGDAAKKEARARYLHPGVEKLPTRKKEQCEQKFHMKLKELQNKRKKCGSAKK